MPVVNCYSLTVGAYDSILKSELDNFKFLLIDQESDDDTIRWKDNYPDTEYVRFSPRVPLASAWNYGVQKALEDGATHIAILNNDIVLHPKTLKHLMAFMDKTGYLMVTADNIKDRMSLETMQQMELPNEYTDYDCEPINDWRAEGPDFSCFMIQPKTIDVVGWFDENYLGAYCEDQDYHARIGMAHRHAKLHNDLIVDADKIHAKRLSTAPYYHYASQTIVRNTVLRSSVSIQHGRNQDYYIKKFGGTHPHVMDGNGYQQPWADATKNWKDCS